MGLIGKDADRLLGYRYAVVREAEAGAEIHGPPYFPPLPTPLDLRLIESRTLSSRVVYLRYQHIR